MSLGVGARLGHYAVTAKLGEGGMGEVWRATDTQLNRDVALKILPEAFATDPDRLARFQREAQVLASLNHPGIAAIYGIEEQDDTRALVLELVEGPTLADRISKGPIPLDEALPIAKQIAEALEAAHEAGVIHRDLKPANIKVREDGTVKVLDFGLAKALDTGSDGDPAESPTLTAMASQAGVIMGTAAYMSPEQARGQDVDHRTDIWSLGVVLYEMLAGQPPFQGENLLSLADAIRNGDPEPVSGPASALTPALSRAMSKDAKQRYQAVTELLDDLRAGSGERGSVSMPSTKADLPSIAVLPFVNMSADAEQEYFCDGMAEEIINALTKIDGLRVVARTSTFQFKGQALDLREVGKKLAATTVLEGSVRKAGDRLRVTAQLINVSDGYHMWSDTYDRQLDDVFAIQDEVSQAIRDVLRVKLLPAADTASPARPTEDMEAYQLYLRGRHHFHKHTEDGWAQAVDAFSLAIARDPSYAQPHVGLATTLWWMAFLGSTSPHEAYPKARQAALHALALDESIGDAHGALAAVKTQYDWDWAGAKVEFDRAIELAPRSTDTLQAYSVYLLNLGWLDEAIAVTKREIELDPLFVKAHQDLGYEYYLARRFDESEAQLTATVELDPHHPPTYLCLAFTYLAQGRIVEAIDATDRGSNLVGESPIYEAVRGWAYAAGGRVEEARAILDRLEGEWLPQHASSVNLAWVYTGLGDIEKALDCLDRAYHERAAMLISLPTFLGWDPLRSDPRFHDLLRLMRFPQPP